MLIEEIFCDLRDRLMSTGIYRIGYEYVEMKSPNSSKGGLVEVPRYVTGSGSIDVYNLDKDGSFYIRKTSDSTIALDQDRMTVTPCSWDKYIILTMPCRVVAAVPVDKFSNFRFADEIHVSTIIGSIQGKLSITDTDTQVMTRSTNTIASKIWSEEIKGVEFKEMNFERFSYVSVDFNIQVKAHMSCLSDCQNEY